MTNKRSKRKQSKNNVTITVGSLEDALVTAFAIAAQDDPSPRKKGIKAREEARLEAQIPKPKRRLTYEYEEENFDDYEPDILNEDPGVDVEAQADAEADKRYEEDKQKQHQIEEEESFDHLFKGQSMDPLDNDVIDRGWGLDDDKPD